MNEVWTWMQCGHGWDVDMDEVWTWMGCGHGWDLDTATDAS